MGGFWGALGRMVKAPMGVDVGGLTSEGTELCPNGSCPDRLSACNRFPIRIQSRIVAVPVRRSAQFASLRNPRQKGVTPALRGRGTGRHGTACLLDFAMNVVALDVGATSGQGATSGPPHRATSGQAQKTPHRTATSGPPHRDRHKRLHIGTGTETNADATSGQALKRTQNDGCPDRSPIVRFPIVRCRTGHIGTGTETNAE